MTNDLHDRLVELHERRLASDNGDGPALTRRGALGLVGGGCREASGWCPMTAPQCPDDRLAELERREGDVILSALSGDPDDHGPGCDGPYNCVCGAVES